MIPYLLMMSVALAAEPWAGIPLDRAAELGLGGITVSEVAGEWRAPLAGGGLVRVMTLPDEAAAREVFAFQRASSATRSPPDLQQADEAAGDDAFRIVRDRNVVIVVRDHAAQAGQVADRLRAALVTKGCEGVWKAGWDRCGVRLDP